MKIAIIGSPGSGKSTFAFKLHKILNIPLFHIDQYFFTPYFILSYGEPRRRVTELGLRVWPLATLNIDYNVLILLFFLIYHLIKVFAKYIPNIVCFCKILYN